MPKECATIKEIKAFRIRVDVNINDARSMMIDRSKDSRLAELAESKVYEHLIEAKMWLGKCLEAMGTSFPAELADKADPRGKMVLPHTNGN